MPLVVDVSALLGVILPDEDGSYAAATLQEVNADLAVVPSLFWFEIRNAVVMSERRNRLTIQQTAAFFADLALQPFEVDRQPHEATVLNLARRHRLTVYDAAYLELAQRRQLPMATLDRELRAAAPHAGVVVWAAP